jgi:hypothetical protein
VDAETPEGIEVMVLVMLIEGTKGGAGVSDDEEREGTEDGITGRFADEVVVELLSVGRLFELVRLRLRLKLAEVELGRLRDRLELEVETEGLKMPVLSIIVVDRDDDLTLVELDSEEIGVLELRIVWEDDELPEELLDSPVEVWLVVVELGIVVDVECEVLDNPPDGTWTDELVDV